MGSHREGLWTESEVKKQVWSESVKIIMATCCTGLISIHEWRTKKKEDLYNEGKVTVFWGDNSESLNPRRPLGERRHRWHLSAVRCSWISQQRCNGKLKCALLRRFASEHPENTKGNLIGWKRTLLDIMWQRDMNNQSDHELTGLLDKKPQSVVGSVCVSPRSLCCCILGSRFWLFRTSRPFGGIMSWSFKDLVKV